MATYVILNICFIAIVLAMLRPGLRRPSKAWLTTLGLLLILTALFDTIIINLGVVGYTESTLLGIYIGSAPIEDFFYAILAAILVPTVWNKLGVSRATKH